MKAYIDLQNDKNRNSKHRVRLIDSNFEKTIKYYKTYDEAKIAKEAINKTIKIIG